MIAAIGMAAGALIWLAFELFAVFTGGSEHTTSYYVQTAVKSKAGWAVRIVVILALASLGLHFLAGFPLFYLLGFGT